MRLSKMEWFRYGRKRLTISVAVWLGLFQKSIGRFYSVAYFAMNVGTNLVPAGRVPRVNA
jgi:hypothetical protein